MSRLYNTKNKNPIVIKSIAPTLGTKKTEEFKKKLKNNPEASSYFFLAEKLHKTIGEIMQMPVEEFNLWLAYFENKIEIEQQAIQKAKLKNGRR